MELMIRSFMKEDSTKWWGLRSKWKVNKESEQDSTLYLTIKQPFLYLLGVIPTSKDLGGLIENSFFNKTHNIVPGM